MKNIVNIAETTVTKACRLESKYLEKKSRDPKSMPTAVLLPIPIAMANEIPVKAENTRIFGRPNRFHTINRLGQNKILPYFGKNQFI